ncbi:MAG: GntR family transcriptional regulator [Acidimicrobiales bacterium]|jgi:DNA-binding GntR family transcriptional regulator|nr:GntR family transcriptional regulator [Acidimicrobiales bacterium]
MPITTVKATSVRPPTLSEAVLLELRQMLIKGRFAPGDHIRVDQLAAEFGVSALPVREALRVLLAEERVDYSPHRGYRLSTLDIQGVEEIFLMCRLLEAEGLRRGVPVMGAKGVRQMRAMLERLETEAAALPLWERVAIHQDFHFVPVAYAQLPRIEALLRRLWGHTDHYRSLYFFHEADQASIVNEDHHALVEACATGDGELAVAVSDRHREHVIERVRQAMSTDLPPAR